MSLESGGAPPVIEVRDLTVAFLAARNMPEILLSIRAVNGLCEGLGLFKAARKRKEVLKGISFVVPRGTIFGILGINGAGKSTLLSCIAGLLGPTSGSVLINGLPVQPEATEDRRGFVKSSRKDLYPGFSAMENMDFMAGMYGLDTDGVRRAAQRLLDVLGVTRHDQENEDVGRLSLGTAGKVALVRALIPLLANRAPSDPPPVLLLDEPTLGFDQGSKLQFFAALSILRRQIPSLTVVVATNDKAEAANCDEYLAIVDGKTVSCPELLAKLKESMASERQAESDFLAMVGQTLPSLESIESTGEGDGGLTVAKAKSPSVTAAFWRRGWRDLSRNYWTSFFVVLSFVLPNLIGLTATLAAQEKSLFHCLVMTCLGVYYSLLAREMLRLLDRERGYYQMIEVIIQSPVKWYQHFWATMSSGILTKSCHSLAVALLLGVLAWGSVSADVQRCVGSLTFERAAGLVCTFTAVSLFLAALGLATAVLPFMMRSDNVFFLLGLLPTVLVLCSGLYYDHSRLPAGLQWLAVWNPLTYGTAGFRQFLGLTSGGALPGVTLLQSWCPLLSEGWSCVLVLSFATVITGVLGSLTYTRGLAVLRRMGRLR